MEGTALFPWLPRLNLRQDPGETLHIRQLENGLERPCGRSRAAPRRLASLVVADAFAGELTRGSIGTIPETIEIENTQRYREDLWLSKQDSNQRMHFICIICIAFSRRKTRAKLRDARCGEFAARNSMSGEGAGCYSDQVSEDVRADFTAQNRLDFRRIVRIGVVMGWPMGT